MTEEPTSINPADILCACDSRRPIAGVCSRCLESFCSSCQAEHEKDCPDA